MAVILGARHVVVGVDGSAESVAALEWACREAALRGAEVLAVLAVEAPCHHGASYAVPAPRPPGGSWGSARDVLRGAVCDAAGRFPGVTIRTQVAEGLAARVLLDFAADADMLILGRTPHAPDPGRGPGPVIRVCLRSATCPVVVVGPARVPAPAVGRPSAAALVLSARDPDETIIPVPVQLALSPAVRAAIRDGAPVVALESTIISHGLPRPANLDAAREFEALLSAAGVVPATIALVDGVPKVGLPPADLERIACDDAVLKIGSRDIAIAIARKMTGGTTVAATSELAARAGIRVFATGGLGGVHRGAAETFDESADLTVLSRTPITVVSAGVKAILDIPATLERLETLGVAVVGYRTSRFPAFWLSDSGYDLDWRVDAPAEIADIILAREEFGDRSALLVANPVPPAEQLDPDLLRGALDGAMAAAAQAGIRGKAVSPFLLDRIQRVTGGQSSEVNLRVVRGNVELAGKISRSLTEQTMAPRDRR